MTFPIHHLPVLQNWDCHVCGTCCQEYVVTVTDEERRRIEAQGWDPETDLGGYAPFSKHGPPWRRRYVLNHRADGSCVFLSDKGRCRIHERFGYETKPLPCRLFPFVLVPVSDFWTVGMRFACPSAAANKGRPVAAHDPALREFAARLAEREGLKRQPDGTYTLPPRLHGSQRLGWPDLLRVVDVLLKIVRDRRDPLERRLRKCLTLARQMRGARLDQVKGSRLSDLLDVLSAAASAETPADARILPPPGWIGRILFRQAAALYLRKDHGPNRGLAGKGRTARLWAAWRFVRGRGPVPRMHGWLPETTFEQLETSANGSLSPEAEEILERYYLVKIGSLQFCGAASFGLPFWEGLESLLLTFPILLWVARAFREDSRAEAVTRALSIVDDHFGFNRVLASTRQRLSFRILAGTGELSRLIAWYSR
jgi:lysine-N-methylase